MTTNIATTPSQSARLLQCGVDPETADMSWYKAKAVNKEGYTWMLISENYLKRRNSDEFIPAWSLSSLLGLLPKEIEDYHLSIESFRKTHYTTYIRDNYDDYLISHKDAPELIDALHSLLVWCLEKGYVKI